MPDSWPFQVANPSGYWRSDYVEIDLNEMGVPEALEAESLRLWRLYDGMRRREVVFQIDRPFGGDFSHRVMTFLSLDTPPGPDDYSQGSARYEIERAAPTAGLAPPESDRLWIGYYHLDPKTYLGDAPDGFNRSRDKSRKLRGVKLFSNLMEIYFSLVPRDRFASSANFTGSATSVGLRRVKDFINDGNVLAPFSHGHGTAARWGQLTHLSFYRLPWEQRWYQTESLLEKDGGEREYALVWAQDGPVRATATFKSGPILVRYQGRPYLTPDRIEIRCHLYRVISMYPGRDYYTEQLSVRTESGATLACRAYYQSVVPDHDSAQYVARFEHIPDYFAVWRGYLDYFEFGYGFAADSHCRQLDPTGGEIRWRLQLGHIHNCAHYFMFHHRAYDQPHDRFHQIGHGWYERVFKPLRVFPYRPYLEQTPG